MAFRFRIVIELPALEAAINRYLDMQEGVQQKRIDELAAKLAASNTKLDDAVDASSPQQP